MYNINWRLLIFRVLPTFLRNKINFWVEWVYTLAFPMVQLHQEFLQFRNDSILELHFNAQTLLLEKLLNDKFSVTTINIINNISSAGLTVLYPYVFGIDSPLIYPHSFNIFSPVILPFALQPSINSFNFTIEVPTALTTQEEVFKALVNKYNHSGFSYNIVYI